MLLHSRDVARVQTRTFSVFYFCHLINTMTKNCLVGKRIYSISQITGKGSHGSNSRQHPEAETILTGLLCTTRLTFLGVVLPTVG